MCNLQVLPLNGIISFWRLGSWSKSYGFIPPCAVISMWGLQTNFFPPPFGGSCNHPSPKWWVVHSTRFAWYGSLWEFNRDERFLRIPTTELLAGLPSTSKPNRALPGVGKQHKKQCLVCKKQFYCPVLLNKPCLGYEKYQWSRAYLLCLF